MSSLVLLRTALCWCALNNNNNNNNHLTDVCPGQPGYAGTRRNFTRSHPSWSTYFLYHLSPFATVHGILFIQLTCLTVLSKPLSRSSLVFPLVLNSQLHTPCISSPNHHHLFAAHAHTNAACSAAVSVLCHLHLVSLSAPYLGVYLFT